MVSVVCFNLQEFKVVNFAVLLAACPTCPHSAVYPDFSPRIREKVKNCALRTPPFENGIKIMRIQLSKTELYLDICSVSNHQELYPFIHIQLVTFYPRDFLDLNMNVIIFQRRLGFKNKT